MRPAHVRARRLCFKSVPVDFAATQRGAWPHTERADSTACCRRPR